jgi:hypothetical protein
MKTGSWSSAGAMPGRVGICLWAPRGAIAGFRLYRPLAPTKEMLKMSRAQYVPLYEAILAKLDPQKVWDDVHALAGKDAAGQQIEPIMLCWERPPWTANNWCHRTMAAAFLEKHLGVKIPELNFEQAALAL